MPIGVPKVVSDAPTCTVTTSAFEVLTGALSTIIGTVEPNRISWAMPKPGWPAPQVPRTEPANAVTSPPTRLTSCTVRVPPVMSAHPAGTGPPSATPAWVAVAVSLMS